MGQADGAGAVLTGYSEGLISWLPVEEEWRKWQTIWSNIICSHQDT